MDTDRELELLRKIEALAIERARLRKALEDIREATEKRQLPLTDQIYRRADAALLTGGPA